MTHVHRYGIIFLIMFMGISCDLLSTHWALLLGAIETNRLGTGNQPLLYYPLGLGVTLLLTYYRTKDSSQQKVRTLLLASFLSIPFICGVHNLLVIGGLLL